MQTIKALWGRKPIRWAAVAAATALLALCLWLALRPADPEAAAAVPVIVCGDDTVDNTELNYYFWMEYTYLIGSYGDDLPDSLDPSKPLSEQAYDGETTWQDFLLTQTMDMIQRTKALVYQAADAGFTMPEDYQTSLERVLSALADNAAGRGFTAEDGSPDVAAYLEASFGPGADEASFAAYLEDSYLAAAYSDQLQAEPVFTAEEIEAYYDQYARDYEAAGIPKEEEPLRSVRMVLVLPEDGDLDGARSSAETLLATWQAESGTEADFAALAESHSAASSAADGGLMAHLAPSDLTGELASWVFDDSRAPGDTAVLETDGGWAAVYFVGTETATVWQKAAEEDLRWETYQNAVLAAVDACDFQIDYDAIVIAQPADLSGAAESSAAG